MFLFITIYRLPRAIKVISAVPVNHFSGLVRLHMQCHKRKKVVGKSSAIESEKTVKLVGLARYLFYRD